jgi:hypothetical protein
MTLAQKAEPQAPSKIPNRSIGTRDTPGRRDWSEARCGVFRERPARCAGDIAKEIAPRAENLR